DRHLLFPCFGPFHHTVYQIVLVDHFLGSNLCRSLVHLFLFHVACLEVHYPLFLPFPCFCHYHGRIPFFVLFLYHYPYCIRAFFLYLFHDRILFFPFPEDHQNHLVRTACWRRLHIDLLLLSRHIRICIRFRIRQRKSLGEQKL